MPWVFFTIISKLIEHVVGALQPDAPFNGPLWFLQTIFCALIIYSIVHMVVKPKIVHLICFLIPVLVFFCSKLMPLDLLLPFHLSRAVYAVFFIHVGWCYKKLSVSTHGRYAQLIAAACLYVLGLFLSIKYYDVSGASYVNTKGYLYNMPLSIITALSGVLFVLTLSNLISRVRFVNWMGRNSLVILCVHFPVMERLNYVCFYFFTDLHVEYMPYKLILVVLSYVLTILFSIVAVQFCKRYIPKLSGYAHLIPIK